MYGPQVGTFDWSTVLPTAYVIPNPPFLDGERTWVTIAQDRVGGSHSDKYYIRSVVDPDSIETAKRKFRSQVGQIIHVK